MSSLNYGWKIGKGQRNRRLMKTVVSRDEDKLSALTSPDDLDEEDDDEDQVYVMKYCPYPSMSNLLAFGTQSGLLAIYNTRQLTSFKKKITNKDDTIREKMEKRNLKPVVRKEFHTNGIYDLTWSHRSILTASADRSIMRWAIERLGSRKVTADVTYSFDKHHLSVKCVEYCPADFNMFASASRDNTVKVWDLRCFQNPDVATLYAPHEVLIKRAPLKSSKSKNSKSSRSRDEWHCCSVTSVKFIDRHRLITCSDRDGILKIWDLRKTYSISNMNQAIPSQTLKHPNLLDDENKSASGNVGITSLAISSNRNSVYASSIDSKIYKYMLNTNELSGSFSGCQMSYSSRIALSPDDNLLIAGSTDSNVYIWNTAIQKKKKNKSSENVVTPIITLSGGHDSEVSCVDWSSIGDQFVTSSEDSTRRLWHVQYNHHVNNHSDDRNSESHNNELIYHLNEKKDRMGTSCSGDVYNSPVSKFVDNASTRWNTEFHKSIKNEILTNGSTSSLNLDSLQFQIGSSTSWKEKVEMISALATETAISLENLPSHQVNNISSSSLLVGNRNTVQCKIVPVRRIKRKRVESIKSPIIDNTATNNVDTVSSPKTEKVNLLSKVNEMTPPNFSKKRRSKREADAENRDINNSPLLNFGFTRLK